MLEPGQVLLTMTPTGGNYAGKVFVTFRRYSHCRPKNYLEWLRGSVLKDATRSVREAAVR